MTKNLARGTPQGQKLNVMAFHLARGLTVRRTLVSATPAALYSQVSRDTGVCVVRNQLLAQNSEARHASAPLAPKHVSPRLFPQCHSPPRPSGALLSWLHLSAHQLGRLGVQESQRCPRPWETWVTLAAGSEPGSLGLPG